MEREVTNERIDEWIEGASWLKREAESLCDVIDVVPYDQSAPDQGSVLDKLNLLALLQEEYFRPLLEKAAFGTEEELFGYDIEQITAVNNRVVASSDVQLLLERLSSQRSGILELAGKLPAEVWERRVIHDGEEYTLYEFAMDLVVNDHKILKEIADLVLLFIKESQSQRELTRNRPGSLSNPNDQSPGNCVE